MINWLKRKLGVDLLEASLAQRDAVIQEHERAAGAFSTHKTRAPLNLEQVSEVAFPVQRLMTVGNDGKAMDEAPCVDMGYNGYRFTTRGGVPDNVIGWFLSQSFIGHQLCAVMSQNWLINRACKIPAEDATRNGWNIEGIEDSARLEDLDKAWGMKRKAQEFARFNRVFGVRIAIYKMKSNDPKYYEKPFNPDSVVEGSYLGITQVDPNWCAPQFDQRDLTDPDAQRFYEPTYWMIMGKLYHHSHLCVIRYAEVSDLLKPTYQFGGIPLPQLIWERVYAAERSANEGPQLLLTKRMNVIKTDLDAAAADPDNFREKNQLVAEMRDNYAQMAIGLQDEYEQHETSLSDFDAVTMTEYQLVAGVAEMPATKLIGTTPKGFNSTGEYEQGVYRETLATIQEHHCTPLLEGHYLRAVPSLGLEGVVDIVWNPLDEPTEEQQAATNLVKAQTRQIYQDLGVVSQEQTQHVVREDKTLGYEFEEDEDGGEDELTAAILALNTGTPVQPKTSPSNTSDEQGNQSAS